MVLLSLGFHLLIVLTFAGVLLPRFPQESRPVYYVDLMNLPVKNPQAGRPQARPRKAQPATPKTAPKQKAPPLVHPRQKSTAKVVLPTKSKPKAKLKPKTKTNPAADKRAYQKVLQDIEEMQRQKKIEALKRKLAALGKSEDRPAPATAAPVGMPTGQGDQKGVAYEAWIHDYLKKAWALSRYQVSNVDLSATVELKFDSRGYLVDYRFVTPSGDERFDQSVKKAILQLTRLPTAPGNALTLEIAFNLKDLME